MVDSVMCTLCPRVFVLQVAHTMHHLKSQVYGHLASRHGLKGRARNLESDKITLGARV